MPRWIAFLARGHNAYTAIDVIVGGAILALVLTWLVSP